MELPAVLIDCSSCGDSFEGQWHADVIDIEQLDEPPVCEQTCGGCGAIFEAEYPGWTEFGGAG